MSEVSTAISSRVFYHCMGSGPAVVLLHGFPENGTLWRQVWDALASSFTLIIPDLPGSGQSMLEQPTGMDDMAICIKAILDKERIAQAVLAGHSMGGYVGLAFARLYPGMVAGLSLVHSTPTADDEEKIKTRQKSIELVQKGGKQLFISQVVPNLFSDHFKQSHPATVKEQVEQALKMTDAGIINFYKAMMLRPDSTGMLRAASFPMQWIMGKDDNIIPYPKILAHCHQYGVNFVSLYKQCGHMSMIEVPALLGDDLVNFAHYCYDRLAG